MRPRILLAFLLLFVQRVYGADNPRVEYIGIERGLSNNAVTSVYQDHHGFMWFGTYDGLNRYDGYSFKVFRNVIGDSASLAGNHIYTISGDAGHNLWIGGSKGMNLYNPANTTFTTPRYLSWDKKSWHVMNAGVGIIQSDAKGLTILAGTHDKGLLVFEEGSLSGMQIPLAASNRNGGNYTVTAIEYDDAGKTAWIAVSRVGLCQYDIKSKKLKVVNTVFKQADCLKLNRGGKLLLGNNDGLYLYDIKSASFSENVMPSKNKVTSLFQDKNNVLWIGSDGGGLWYLAAGSAKATPYLSDNGTDLVNSNAVYAVYGDAEGRKWVGTLRGGINVFHPSISFFPHITYHSAGQNNIINNFILSFCEDENNNVWIGTDGAGLRYWNRRQNKFRQFIAKPADKNSISSNFITGILEDSEADIWFSTWYGGINRLKKGSGRFERYTCFNPVSNAEENNVWLLFEDKQKRLWASTVNNGTLYLFNRDKNRFELFDERIINVQCLAEDNYGNLWAGNYTSLLRIDRLQKKHQTYRIGYPVRSIHEDKNKNFWIGTEGGGLLLFNRKDGSYQQFTTAEGLPNNTILRILEDDRKNLWLSTYNGLCKFNTAQKTCRNFSQTDGLQSNQFSFNAGLRLKTGEFLFGGIKGFNIFYPDSVYDRKETPPVFLAGIRINNTSIEEDDSYLVKKNVETPKQVNVPFHKAILSLEFLALEYTSADKIKYAYQLEGWDKNWIHVNTARTANYSRLREGEYIFKVKTTNADGVWSNDTTLLKVKVFPPWYRTWWAYLLYVLSLAAVVYLYILYSKRQERLRYEIRLAHLEKEKEKELTERKITFFTHISHELRTPLTLIINPLKELFKTKDDDKAGKDISIAYRNARRLLSLVDQLLIFRKVDSVDQQLRIERFDMMEVCKEVYLSFSQNAQVKNIAFVFNRNDHPVSIYGDREKIEIILFNLLSNAFKYTKAGGTIIIGILEKEHDIEISVKDTGAGIAPEIGNKLFDSFYRADSKYKASRTGFGIGLYVSYKLAEAHHGKLSYTSQPGTGTEFRLMLLKGKKHFGTQHISDDFVGGETILQELMEEPLAGPAINQHTTISNNKSGVIDKLTSDLPAMVIVDDNADIRSYLKEIFADAFVIYEADDGTGGFELVLKETPNIVISDVMMKHLGGIELCQKIKDNPVIAHIPVILLTASSSDQLKLEGISGGAEDYITKPFDKEIIIARVRNILKGRNRLQQYFFNAITLQPATNIAGEHKAFIEQCISIVEKHLDNPDFNIKAFCREIGMSHPALYKKVKAVSGLTINVFIRYLRLRKAAELLINTDKNIIEISYVTGFNDVRYFREQFNKLFEMNPSEYIKHYRRVLKIQDE